MDLLADITLGQAIVAATTLATFVAVIFKVWPWLSRLKNFIDDLMGEPARPGVEARPGVLERLAGHEAEIASVREVATSAEYHSRPNGGGSAYDRLMQEVRGIRDGLDEHIRQATDIHDEQAAAIAHLAESMPIIARSTPHPDDAAEGAA